MWIEKNFIFILILVSIISLRWPHLLSGLKSTVPWLLSLIMLSMGVTLKTQDFTQAIKHPLIILLGTVLQFIIMPLTAYLIAKLFQLPQDLLIGCILVGSCPGGTASNIICYLSKANVALSITLTCISTLLAPIITPLWIWVLLHQHISISMNSLISTSVQIILIPIFIGLLVQKYLKKYVTSITKYIPSITIILISVIIGYTLSINQKYILSSPMSIIIVIICHNLLGAWLTYTITSIMKLPPKTIKTLTIEVGMQNSGFAVILALKYFSVLSALPGALFSLWHNLFGSLCVQLWKPKNKKSTNDINKRQS